MGKSSRSKSRLGRPRDRTLPARRRAQILAHAIEHFARRGYSGTDLDAIAADVGCAKGTLYNYFPNKRQLFAAAVAHVVRGLSEAVDAGESRDPLDQLFHLVRAFFAYFAASPAYVELLIQERSDFRDESHKTYLRFRSRRRRIWGARLRKLMAVRRVRRMEPERVLEVLTDTLYGTIFNNYLRGRRVDVEQQTADVLAVLFSGLLTAKEAARFHANGR